MKKFILTDETIEMFGVTLHRIKAVRSFGNVKEGDFGGFVEKEENISEHFEAWVYYNAIVCGDAKVYDNAKVYGNAIVCGNAKVYGNVKVYGNAIVCGGAKVYDNAKVYGNAKVCGNAKVRGNAKVYDNAEVWGDAKVYDNAKVYGNAKVCGNAKVRGNAKVYDNADYIVFKNWWSSGRYFTWTRSNNMWSVGCFYGTGEELIKKAYQDSEKSGREYERVVKLVQSILEDQQ